MTEEEFEERFRLAFDTEAGKPNDGNLSRRVTRCFFHGLGKSIEELKPVDPDLLEARRIVKETLSPESHKRCNCREEIDGGEWDAGHKIRASLAAIKRGRQLAREQANG